MTDTQGKIEKIGRRHYLRGHAIHGKEGMSLARDGDLWELTIGYTHRVTLDGCELAALHNLIIECYEDLRHRLIEYYGENKAKDDTDCASDCQRKE